MNRAAFRLFPSEEGIIAVCILVMGLGSSIVSILRRQFQQYRAGEIDRHALVRNSLVEITRTLLTLALSIFLARLAVAYLIARLGGIQGFIPGMLAALLIGVLVGVLVQVTCGRLVKRSIPVSPA